MAELESKPKKPEDVLGKPMQEYYIEVEEVGAGVERYYFWLLNFMQASGPSGVKADEVIKVKDIYGATETSSYWGSIEQRKGLQQDRISQYLATIGKMMKDLFQIIRELRIMDERYDYYKRSNAGDEDAEVALKSIWIDMVEGGAKNPTSVLGLATQVGFTILPDLFFSIHPKQKPQAEQKDEVDRSIQEALSSLKEEGINRKIIEVLGRKLVQYLIWKQRTEREIFQRRNFMLKYLRQHYNVIKMYMDWVRPYLVNLKRLQMKQNPEDVHLISAFESSKIELELIAKWFQTNKETKEKLKYHSYLKLEFTYITIPQMAYQQEYQRGAIHTGKSIIKFKTYALEEEKIAEYKKALEEQDLDLLEAVTGSMDSLKDELKAYLKEAGETIYKEDVEKVVKEASVSYKEAQEALEKNKGDIEKAIQYLKLPSKPSFNPFEGITKGFKEMFTFKKKGEKKEKKSKYKKWQEQDTLDEAKSTAKQRAYTVYDIFKKGNRLTAW